METEKKKLKDLIDKAFETKFTGYIYFNFFKGKPGTTDVKKSHKFKDIEKIKLD